MRLEDYKVEHPNYQYIVPTTISPEDKVELLREFLTPYRDCEEYDFTSSSDGGDDDPITYFIASPYFDGAPKILIQIPTGEKQKAESKAIRNAWVDILQLSCKLEDRWNGSIYHVSKRRSLKCKEMILEQFLRKYEGFQYKVESNYDEKKALQVLADYGSSSVSLVMYYMTNRVGEQASLLAMISEPAPDSPASSY